MNNYQFYFQNNASIYSKCRTSKQTTDENNAETDRSQGTQPQYIYHKRCIRGSWNIVEEETEPLEKSEHQEIFCQTVYPRNDD